MTGEQPWRGQWPWFVMLVLLAALIAHGGLASIAGNVWSHERSVVSLSAATAAGSPTAAEGASEDAGARDGTEHGACTSDEPCHKPSGDHATSEVAISAASTAGHSPADLALTRCGIAPAPAGAAPLPAGPAPLRIAAREPVAVLCVNRN